jgi:hypothetical protein
VNDDVRRITLRRHSRDARAARLAEVFDAAIDARVH